MLTPIHKLPFDEGELKAKNRRPLSMQVATLTLNCFVDDTTGEPSAALPDPDQTVTTILPICSLDSRKRVASWI